MKRSGRVCRLRCASALFALLAPLSPAQESALAEGATVIEPGALEALLRQDSGDNPLRVIAGEGGQYGVFVLSSEPRQPGGGPPGGAYHSAIAEIYHVINGTGVFVTGGVLEDPQEVQGDSARFSRAGPGASGTLRDAQLVEYGPGSIFIVPPGVPHNATYEVRTATDFIIYRFDPMGVLPRH